jgi:dynein intermediate chain 1
MALRVYFLFKNADEDERTQSVEMNEEIIEEDEAAERGKTEEENEGKVDEKQVVKEGEDKQTEGRGGAEEEGEGEEEVEDVSAVPTKKALEESVHCVKGGSKKLTNQFNFCERAALTCNNPCRVSSMQVTCMSVTA